MSHDPFHDWRAEEAAERNAAVHQRLREKLAEAFPNLLTEYHYCAGCGVGLPVDHAELFDRLAALQVTARAFKEAETAFHEAIRAKGPADTRREFEAYGAARRALYAEIDALPAVAPTPDAGDPDDRPPPGGE